MADAPREPEKSPPAGGSPPAEPPPPRRRWWQWRQWQRPSRWKVFILAAVLSPIVILSLYIAIALSWSYSRGERSGVLQKFSRKGWVCKTWEGELAQFVIPGVAPTIWEFTVRDDSVASKVNAVIGRRVVLHYEEHRGIPTTCFGMTPYFVDSVRVLE
jgi:hypothetical protein